MEYNKIIAVTGLPGLYELLSSKSDGAIVRSLDDKTTRFVSSRIHNFSHLESIEVYTVRDNVNLVDILKAMEASSTKLPVEKDGADLKSYFTKVYPDLDFSRVYSSDLKKMVKWFSVLKANNIEIKLSEPEMEPEEPTAVAEEVVKEKPAPNPAPKKKEEKAATAEKATQTEEKPKVKKAAAVPDAPAAKKAAAGGTAKAENKRDDGKGKAAKTDKVKKAEKPAAEKPKKAAKKKK